MNRLLTRAPGHVALVFLFLGAATPPAHAQDFAHKKEAEPPGRGLARAGLGITLASVGLGLGVATPLMIAGHRQQCEPMFCVTRAEVTGVFLAGLAGIGLLVGIPMWVAGAVRYESSHGSGAEARTRIYKWVGVGLFCVGAAASVAGIALLAVERQSPFRPSSKLGKAGKGLLPVGLFVSLFIGLPMWVEAATAYKNRATTAPSPPLHRRLASIHADHDQASADRMVPYLPTAVMFSYAGRF